jgi:hypothetical protein
MRVKKRRSKQRETRRKNAAYLAVVSSTGLYDGTIGVAADAIASRALPCSTLTAPKSLRWDPFQVAS